VEQSPVDVAGWYGDVVRQELELKQAHRKWSRLWLAVASSCMQNIIDHSF
jgi:hypothetical protein